jgi:hypothetical protein
MNVKSYFPLLTALAGGGLGYLVGHAGQGARQQAMMTSERTISAKALSTVTPADASNPVVSAPNTEAANLAELNARFTLLANTSTPEACLAAAMALTGRARFHALQFLMKAWIASSNMSEDAKGHCLAEVDSAAERNPGVALLADVLRLSELEAFRGPWMSAFKDDALRSRMFPLLVGEAADCSPEMIAETCRNWMPWEKAEFTKSTLDVWAWAHPEAAL